MHGTSRVTAFAGVIILGLLCTAATAAGQIAPQPVVHIASLVTGSIDGIVQDEKGTPVSGAVVSALGATTKIAVTDRGGRFELRMLTPGPYLLRVHQTGFVAPRGQIVDVRASARTSSAISMRRDAGVLTAGLGVPASGPDPTPATTEPAGAAGASTTSDDDHGEIAWRLRHARRNVLKDVTIPEGLLADNGPDTNAFGPTNFIGRAVESPARLFGSAPLSGQVNLLTLGSFDTPQQIFSPENFGRSVAYLALGAPVGEHADWTVRAALTQGDIASWLLAGEYTTRVPATHRYDVGWSYSMQRYDGGSLAAWRTVAEGSRNAGALYAYDTYALSSAVTLSYGGGYSAFDYLEGHGLLSPRAAVTISPADHLRVSTLVSRRAVAPGAEEFMPRLDNSVGLPPQRTFSSLVSGHPLQPEYTDHVEVEVERDVALATISLRGFRQHVSDQLVTLFGFDVPGAPAPNLGHYLIGNAGDVDASGISAGLRASVARRMHGSVEYRMARARWRPGDDALVALVLAPSTVRVGQEKIQDLTTSLETEVPETATRVMLLYRVSNAFAAQSATIDRPALDARFDVQVRQGLPFMDFSAAKWEMLVAVRNFFRDTAPDQSLYDELLVVRPPKRIVGGLTLKF